MVKGVMIESYIEPGNQKIGEHIYGKSITDPCLGWEDSERRSTISLKCVKPTHLISGRHYKKNTGKSNGFPVFFFIISLFISLSLYPLGCAFL